MTAFQLVHNPEASLKNVGPILLLEGMDEGNDFCGRCGGDGHMVNGGGGGGNGTAAVAVMVKIYVDLVKMHLKSHQTLLVWAKGK